jgi:chromosomal replication initiator protein
MDIVGAQVVQEAVAAEWGVPADALAGSGRTRRVSQPRRLAMLLCRDVLALSLREIGAAFGARDVSTVFSAITRARDDVRRDVAVFDRVQRVRSELPTKSATATSLR